jgi:acetyl esterase
MIKGSHRAAAVRDAVSRVLGADCSAEQIDPNALAVAKALAQTSRSRISDPAELRRRHAETLTPLLAAKDDVECIVRFRPSGEDVPPMVVLRPKGVPQERRLPALVYLHGGGWNLGSFDTYDPFCRQLANATGRVIVFVDYRLAPEHPFPAALEDTWNAVEWLMANAEWLGLDERQIGLGGDGSGGNLAAATCIAAARNVIEFSPQFQLLISPCLDLSGTDFTRCEITGVGMRVDDQSEGFIANYIGSFPDAADWHLSPLLTEDMNGVAPAIVLYAGFDPMKEQAIAYVAKLDAAGIPSEPLYFPRMIHGFLTMGGAIPDAAIAVQRVASAIRNLTQTS